jgi:hypothetical protein
MRRGDRLSEWDRQKLSNLINAVNTAIREADRRRRAALPTAAMTSAPTAPVPTRIAASSATGMTTPRIPRLHQSAAYAAVTTVPASVDFLELRSSAPSPRRPRES